MFEHSILIASDNMMSDLSKTIFEIFLRCLEVIEFNFEIQKNFQKKFDFLNVFSDFSIFLKNGIFFLKNENLLQLHVYLQESILNIF